MQKKLIQLLKLVCLLSVSALASVINKEIKIYENMVGSIKFDERDFVIKNTDCIKFDSNHVLKCNEEDEEFNQPLIYIKNRKTGLEVLLYPGMSVDPQFVFVSKNKVIGAHFGLNLVFETDSTVIISGHTNNWFNMHEKFIIKPDTMREIKQPFYYTGLKTRASDQFAIYRDESGKDIIDIIKNGDEIEVVIAKCENRSKCRFLVKSRSGLLGWYLLDSYKVEIENLFFYGD